MKDFGDTLYIDKNEILKSYSEFDIFKLVFGEIPVIGEKYLSPFRIDNDAGCFFDYSGNGRLLFYDYASSAICYDCFTAVKLYYNLNNFYETLKVIRDNVVKTDSNVLSVERVKERKRKVNIHINPRNFVELDKSFWQQYYISSENLKEDFVYPLKEIILTNTKKGNVRIDFREIAYCYTNFKSGNKKIYIPNSLNYRFISTCSLEDIGGYEKIRYDEDYIIVTKSYKDFRVIYNQGYNVIWLQNEGMYPKKLVEISLKFSKVFVLFDNDAAGMKASENIVERLLKDTESEIINIKVPLYKNVKDPSDFIKYKGPDRFIKLLKNIICI